MPIVAAVAHVQSPDDLAALTRWAETAGALCGAPRGLRLPLVLDTPDRDADAALWRQLEDHPAVRHLELVRADFSDLHAAGGTP